MNAFEDDGLAGVLQQTAEAATALEALREPAERAAAAIEDAFASAGASLARSLGRAAADGKLSLAELAEAVLAAINAASRVGAGGGLGEALAAVLGGGFGGPRADGGGLAKALATALDGRFSGARAEGGPVASGGAYLVGENGPEVFRPTAAGSVESTPTSGLTVNITVQGEDGGRTLARSEAQLAQALARAVSLGARRL